MLRVVPYQTPFFRTSRNRKGQTCPFFSFLGSLSWWASPSTHSSYSQLPPLEAAACLLSCSVKDSFRNLPRIPFLERKVYKTTKVVSMLTDSIFRPCNRGFFLMDVPSFAYNWKLPVHDSAYLLPLVWRGRFFASH